MIKYIRKFINWVKSFFTKKEVEHTFKRVTIDSPGTPPKPYVAPLHVSPIQKPEPLQIPKIIITPPVNAPYHYNKPAYDRRYLNVYCFIGMPKAKPANKYTAKKNSKLSTLAAMR